MWFYQYEEDENNPDAEPKLTYIDNDEEYENVADAFDEYLDNAEFDENRRQRLSRSPKT